MLRLGILSIAIATTLSAQSACEKGPGVPFGISEYSCANCAIDRPAGQKKSYVFRDDPVVVERTAESPFQPGDLVTAVDGHGLVTPEGAKSFAYPKPGASVVQIKRKVDGKDRLLYTVINVGDDCVLESATPGSATLPTILSTQSEVDSAKLQAAKPARVSSSCKNVGLRVVNSSGADVIFTATVYTRQADNFTHYLTVDSVRYTLGTAPQGMTTIDLPRLKANEYMSYGTRWASSDARGDLKKIQWQEICRD
jgi:hypothetical protein